MPTQEVDASLKAAAGVFKVFTDLGMSVTVAPASATSQTANLATAAATGQTANVAPTFTTSQAANLAPAFPISQAAIDALAASTGYVNAVNRASNALVGASGDDNDVAPSDSTSAPGGNSRPEATANLSHHASASTRVSARDDPIEVTYGPSHNAGLSTRTSLYISRDEVAATSSHNATPSASKMSFARDSSNEGVAESSHHTSASKMTRARNNSNEGMASSSHHAGTSKMPASRNNSDKGTANSSHHASASALTRASARNELMGGSVGSPRNRFTSDLSRNVGFSSHGMGNRNLARNAAASAAGDNATGSSLINARKRSDRLNDDDEDVRGPSPRPYKSRRDYYDGSDSDAGRGDF